MYLKAPLISFSLNHSSWTDSLDKLVNKISYWTYRSINLVRRLILVKAVLQSMSLDLLSVLVSPQWVLKSLGTIQRTFLLGGDKNHPKWALVKWDRVFLPKFVGGLGLRYSEINNKNLSAKLW